MKRHPTPRYIREHRFHADIHTIASKHATAKDVFGAHYGAIYWALSTYFDTCGRRSRVTTEERSRHYYWMNEVTGGGCRPYLPAHDRLWAWAIAIARRERDAVQPESATAAA